MPVPAVHGSGVRPADGSVTSAHLSCFLSVPVSRLLSCSHLHFRERSFRTFGSVGFVSGVIILCATAALTTAVRARVNAGVDTPGESPGYSLAGGLTLTQPMHRRRLYFRVPCPRGYMLLRLTALDFLLLFTREGWYVLSLFFLFSMSPLSFLFCLGGENRDLVSRSSSRDDVSFALKTRLEPWIDCKGAAR